LVSCADRLVVAISEVGWGGEMEVDVPLQAVNASSGTIVRVMTVRKCEVLTCVTNIDLQLVRAQRHYARHRSRACAQCGSLC